MIAIVMVISLQVLAPEFRAHAAPTPPPMKSAASNAASTAIDAVFGDDVRLSAVSAKIDSQIDPEGNEQSSLYVWLTWNTLRSMSAPYTYVVQPISTTGVRGDTTTIASPLLDSYPMTCWKPGDQSLTDRLKVLLPGSGGGDWQLDFALMDPGSGQVLDVTAPNGSHSQSLMLGPFH